MPATLVFLPVDLAQKPWQFAIQDLRHVFHTRLRLWHTLEINSRIKLIMSACNSKLKHLTDAMLSAAADIESPSLINLLYDTENDGRSNFSQQERSPGTSRSRGDQTRLAWAGFILSTRLLCQLDATFHKVFFAK